MDLIKELKTLNVALDNWKAGFALTPEQIDALAEVYNRWREVHPEIGSEWRKGCGGCVADGIKALYNSRAIEIRKVTVPFKGVPEVKVVTIKKVRKPRAKKVVKEAAKKPAPKKAAPKRAAPKKAAKKAPAKKAPVKKATANKTRSPRKK